MATFTFSDNVRITGYGVNQSNTEEPTYVETNNTSVTWTASNAGTYYVWVKDTVGNKSNETFTIVSTAFCAYNVGQTWNYGYTGGVQSFSTPCNGTYKLEVWGAQGGSNPSSGEAKGGYGGYSTGNKKLSSGNNIYIVVGGAGSFYNSSIDTPAGGGYNGGGNAGTDGENRGGGGGATHIATTNRGILANYNSYRSEVLIVAGGGGSGCAWGGDYSGNGGSGGGTSGGNGSCPAYNGYGGKGGTQTAGGSIHGYAANKANASFGTGGTQNGDSNYCGGGGGWYGGSAGSYYGGGGGGSGYIGGVSGGSMQNGVRTGNGYARITLASLSN